MPKSSYRNSRRVSAACASHLRFARNPSPLPNAFGGILPVFDFVPEKAPGRRCADETPPGIERDAGVFECPAGELDAQHAVALVIARGAQVTSGQPFHLHRMRRSAFLALLRLVRAFLAVTAVEDLAAARADIALAHRFAPSGRLADARII